MYLLGGRCLALINAGAGLAVMVGPAFCVPGCLLRLLFVAGCWAAHG
jgi:hypothetical protein